MALGLQTQVNIVLLGAMNTSNTLLHKAIKIVGSVQAIADACGLTNQGVCQWRNRGYLPRTELLGVTEYGKVIEELTGGKVTHLQLLADNRMHILKKAEEKQKKKLGIIMPQSQAV